MMTSDKLSDSAFRVPDAEERRLSMNLESLQFQLAIAEELDQDATTLNGIQEQIAAAHFELTQYQAASSVATVSPGALEQAGWRTGLVRVFMPWTWFKPTTSRRHGVAVRSANLPVSMTAKTVRRMSAQ